MATPFKRVKVDVVEVYAHDLRAIREALGLSVRGMAKILGVSNVLVGKLEKREWFTTEKCATKMEKLLSDYLAKEGLTLEEILKGPSNQMV